MYTIALMLITSPSPVDYKITDFQECRELSKELRTVCINLEILDKRLINNYFFSYAVFDDHVHNMRIRYKTMKNAPLISDAMMLPEFDYQVLNFNLEYQKNLETQRYISMRKWWYDVVISETKLLHTIHMEAFKAKNKNRYIYERRESLNYLRNTLGYKTYYSGRLPPFVPIWRFHKVD